jgi:RNA polymerase sigma-70 factor (ECF subfamily)
MAGKGLRSRTSAIADREAFAAFYRRHESSLLRFFARQIYDPQLALDLTAESFAQAFIGRGRFRGRSRGEEVAWLQTIARRQLARYYRRGRVERDGLERLKISLVPASSEELERIEELAGLDSARTAIREALSALSAEQRRAIELRIVGELPYPEVAAELGVSEQTARARVSRGLRALRQSVPFDLEPEGGSG